MTDGLSGSATAAYTRIYEEQHPRLVAYARSLTRNSWTAEDLVAEAHFRVWRRLSGGHEIDNVPAYLMTTVRHLAAAVGSTATRETPLDPTAPERAEGDVRVADAADPAEQVSSVDLLVRVLGQLPERWVQALWLAEAEGQPLEAVGQRIGAKQGATAVLLHRAREGMRQAFLREQPGAPIDPACQVRWGRMPAYVRGTATGRQSEQLLSHVDACDDCRARLAVLMRTNDRLPALVGPALLVFVVGGGGGKVLMALTGGSAGTAAVFGSAGAHGSGGLLHAVRQVASGGSGAGGVGGVKVPTVAAVGAAAAAAAVVAGIVLGPLDSGAGPAQRVPVAQAPAPHRPEAASPDVVERRGALTDAVDSTAVEGDGGAVERGAVRGADEEGAVAAPGGEEAAGEEPGGWEPGVEEPGAQEPGAEEPGAEEPGPAEPAGPVVEPPVEEVPPVVEPPVEEGPSVVEPPVDEAPPVVEPPTEEAPPVVEPPVVEPPVEDEPGPPDVVEPGGGEAAPPGEPLPEDPGSGVGGPGGGC
ncbi:sigma-70 family RNA polymerase sigma factor [Streptomyces sp. NPDC013978]|uniref:sigma-70 family RNA polymerase sigma factor n=1 Tax=Streptomyces sp. NPDC013978 TaxID=3364869 RepID=UPI0036FAD462